MGVFANLKVAYKFFLGGKDNFASATFESGESCNYYYPVIWNEKQPPYRDGFQFLGSLYIIYHLI